MDANDSRHGTANGYQNLGCRCRRCTRAHTIYYAGERDARAVQLGPCTVEGCDRGQYAKGLCHAHYERQLRSGDVGEAWIQESSVRDNVLRCVTCREWYQDAFFPRSSADPHRRGRHQSCTDCNNDYRRAYREANKVPCEDCGTPVEGKGRANTSSRRGYRVRLDPDRPYLCATCSRSRKKTAA